MRQQEWLYDCAHNWQRLGTDAYLADEEDEQPDKRQTQPEKPSVKGKRFFCLLLVLSRMLIL